MIEEEVEEDGGEEQNVKESKTEDKGDLAGERQSGDGQVRGHVLVWQNPSAISESLFLLLSIHIANYIIHSFDLYLSLLSLCHRSQQWTPRQRCEVNRAKNWMTMRTVRTQPTSPGRGCSLSTTSEATPKRRKGKLCCRHCYHTVSNSTWLMPRL